ncbi:MULTISPECIES: hypothetical protein [Tenacibaculum]|uniref:hypothetical protein n=1 Tax=Tenacibaculum TaxID=104267 RepID=UPI001588005D|nr:MULTISPECIES: hypothetical protein [Tenacibaculum]MCF2873115.1 hypothetical protein [Tenacibaculum sp. Cn5-1]MCF2933271.1 hypothetical protein [Tenacibaculum sp. Cn5-34]MCG7510148.1 hypothetical protein [Tenacibaculum sp. Cn5-46]
MLKTISNLGSVLNKSEQKSVKGSGGPNGEIHCPNYCPKYLPYSCLCDWGGGH